MKRGKKCAPPADIRERASTIMAEITATGRAPPGAKVKMLNRTRRTTRYMSASVGYGWRLLWPQAAPQDYQLLSHEDYNARVMDI